MASEAPPEQTRPAPAPDDGGPATTQGALVRLGSAVVRQIRENAVALVVLVLLVWLIGGPLYYLARMSLGSGNPVNPGPLTLLNYRSVFADGRTYTVLVDTLLYSTGVTIVSLTLAGAAAWLIERTDFPGRNLAWVAMLAPIAIPGVLASVAWILLAAPQVGSINVFLRWLLGFVGIELSQGPLNVYSMPGMIFVEGVRGTTTVFLMIVGAFRLMDPAMEDAASLSGAGRIHTLRRITIPLMAPALFAAAIYAFLGNLQDFDTPLLLGLPANIFILPTLIYFIAFIRPNPNWGIASAYASIFLIIMGFLVVWYYKVIIKQSRKFQTIAGKGYRPQRIQLGRWKYAAVGGFFVFFMISLGLPLLVLFWGSLLPSYQPPSIAQLANVSLDNYVRLFNDTRMIAAFRNSAVMAFGAATVGIVVAFGVSWAIVRLRVRGALLMDGMAFVPNAIPTIAIGLGFVVLYLSPIMNWTRLYGTLAIMGLALVVNYLAFATRIGNGAMTQLSAELEEQAWVAGHGKGRTLLRVTFPLLLPSMVAGWVWIFAASIRNLTIPLLLSTPRTEVIALRLFQVWTLDGIITYAATIATVMLVLLLAFAFAARSLIQRGFTSD